MAKQEREVERWITVNGVRVPIFKDGSVGGPKAIADKIKNKTSKNITDVTKMKPGDTIEIEQFSSITGKSTGYKTFTLGSNNRWSSEDGEDFDNNEHELTKHSTSNKTGVQGNIRKKDSGSKEKKSKQIDKDNDLKEKQIKQNNEKAKTDNITSAKTHKELTDKLSKNGLKLDSADAHTMENSNSLNGDKVTMYDKDGNEYSGTYNKYSDGGREIVNIKKTGESPRKIARDNETLKEKQIKQNEAERNKLNAKYADEEHHPTAMGDVKKGDFFKLSNKPNAKVYVRDEYDKSEKAYWCHEYYDVNSGRYIKKNKTVYTGFTF